MNPALVAAFDPLSYACEGCGRARYVACPEKRFADFVQLNCPERVRAAHHYGMKATRVNAPLPAPIRSLIDELQPNGAA